MDDHAFRWPDEDPAPQAPHAVLRATLSRTARALVVARPATRPGRRWRLPDLLRTRPLPLALWLAIGLGPLAWAVRGLDAWPPRTGAQPPAGTEARAERAPPGAAPAAPQWGEPLPQFRHLFEADADAQPGPPLPPSLARRSSGSVVLASEYFAAQRAGEATGDRPDAPAAAPASPPVAAANPPPPSAADTGAAGITAWAPAALPEPPERTPSAPVSGRSPRLAELADVLQIATVADVGDPGSAAPAATAAWTLPATVERGLQRSGDVRSARTRLDAFRELARASAPSGWRGTSRDQAFARDRASRRPAGEPSAVDREQALVTAADIVWRATTSEVAGQVARAYLQALHAHTVLTLTAEHERELRHLAGLRAVREARDRNRRAEYGLLRLQAARARARATDARVVQEASRDHLASLVGAQPRGLALQMPAAWRAPLDLPSALAQAARHNLALQASQSELTALAFEAWSAQAPAGTAQPTAPGLGLAPAPTDRRPPARPRPGAPRPFDDGGPLLQPVAARFQGAAAAPAHGLELRQHIDHELQSAYAALRGIDGRYAPLREALNRQRHRVVAARTQLMAGRGPVQALVDAYREQHEQRIAIAALLFEEATQHVRIALLTGHVPLGTPTVVATR